MYGSTNNFHKFKEAFSERAIKEYGHLGKLIKQGTYYIPTYISVDWTTLLSSVTNILETESLKKYQKQMDNMMRGRPKLYGLIMEHISMESKDAMKTEVDYTIWHANKDPKNYCRHWRKHTRLIV